jgi:hypothetical protein
MNGKRLHGTTAGLLFSLLLGSIRVNGADVWLYKATKGIHYQQSASGGPVVLTNNGYVFQANVFLTAPGNATGATIVSQEGTVRTLEFDDDDELEFRNRVNTKSTLETRYPDGNFRFTINTLRDGTRTPTLPLLGNAYPNAPHLHNVAALQAQNANGYIVVMWNPLAGGSANDFIQLRIEDSSGDLVWESDDLGEAGALDGTSTFALIKAGNLKPSLRYEAALLFEKSCGQDTTSYAGAFGWSTYHTRTEFTLGTTSAAEPNVKTYELRKGRGFKQTTSAPPVPEAGNEFMFAAEIKANGANRVNSASVTTPAGSTATLAANSDRDEFDFSESASTQSALDEKYPAGTYTLNIQTASDGGRSPALYFAATAYPPAPRVHFDPTQPVPAQQELRIVWDAWPGATANDFIQLRIENSDDDMVFETPDFDDKDALDGRATSATVPANTLIPGKSYKARLSFHRCVAIDSSSYAGALGQALYFTRTKFDIETVAPDVKGYEVRKTKVFVQSNSGAPVATGFVFSATLDAENDSSIITAAIITPGGRPNLLFQQSDGETFRFRDTRTTQAALDADYPDGNYMLSITGANDGARNIPVALTGSVYPNSPRLSDYDAAGEINGESAFVLRWDAFAGGTANDFIRLQIEEMDGDEVFDTEDFGNTDALDGRATSATISPGLLDAARMYSTELHFERILRANDAGYPGVDGRVGYAAQTFAKIATSGAGNPPALSDYRKLPDGRVQFFLSTLDDGTYEIHGSPNLRDWTTLGTILATGNRTTFTAPPPPAAPGYFYRGCLMR